MLPALAILAAAAVCRYTVRDIGLVDLAGPEYAPVYAAPEEAALRPEAKDEALRGDDLASARTRCRSSPRRRLKRSLPTILHSGSQEPGVGREKLEKQLDGRISRNPCSVRVSCTFSG